MAKDYASLLSSDSAWPELEKEIAASGNGPLVLPAGDERRDVLELLQVSTKSTLGAIAHECGGILVDHGWLRVLGSGHPKLPRSVGGWNEEVGVGLGDALIVADDVVGGVFAINGGALGDAVGNVFYFAPDTLEWEDTELRHSDWMGWVLTGDLAKFYETFRWAGWEKEVEALNGDQSIHFWPPAWSEEGANIAAASRKTVPAAELFAWMFDEAAGDEDDEALVAEGTVLTDRSALTPVRNSWRVARHVQQSPHRESRRDRLPRDPYLQAPRHRHRGRLLRRRRGHAPRARRR